MAGIIPLRQTVRDVTGALRSRRYRTRKSGNEINASVTVNGKSIDTIAMCALAGRLSAGRVTVEDLDIASRLITHLVYRLPENAVLDVTPIDEVRR
jgi:hypothetical protein